MPYKKNESDQLAIDNQEGSGEQANFQKEKYSSKVLATATKQSISGLTGSSAAGKVASVPMNLLSAYYDGFNKYHSGEDLYDSTTGPLFELGMALWRTSYSIIRAGSVIAEGMGSINEKTFERMLHKQEESGYPLDPALARNYGNALIMKNMGKFGTACLDTVSHIVRHPIDSANKVQSFISSRVDEILHNIQTYERPTRSKVASVVNEHIEEAVKLNRWSPDEKKYSKLF